MADPDLNLAAKCRHVMTLVYLFVIASPKCTWFYTHLYGASQTYGLFRSRDCVHRQVRLYEHVARLLADDPAHRIVSCRDPCGWNMPRGRPCASWLRQRVLSERYGHDGHDGPGACLGDGQTESYLKDMEMAGLASAWAMARRRPI